MGRKKVIDLSHQPPEVAEKPAATEVSKPSSSKDPDWTVAGTSGARFIASGKYDRPLYLDDLPCKTARDSINGAMKCEYCDKSFTLELMATHASFHSKIRDSTIICPYCENRFTTDDKLTAHLMS